MYCETLNLGFCKGEKTKHWRQNKTGSMNTETETKAQTSQRWNVNKQMKHEEETKETREITKWKRNIHTNRLNARELTQEEGDIEKFN